MSKLRMEGGHVFDGDRELFTLTMYQQDELIKQLYPHINTITEERRKQTSHSGTHKFDITHFQDLSAQYIERNDCAIAQRVYKWGGVRLLTLYCNKFHFQSAAMDLGLTYGALMKWFQRWRTDALARGLTPEALFRDPQEIVNP